MRSSTCVQCHILFHGIPRVGEFNISKDGKDEARSSWFRYMAPSERELLERPLISLVMIVKVSRGMYVQMYNTTRYTRACVWVIE